MGYIFDLNTDENLTLISSEQTEKWIVLFITFDCFYTDGKEDSNSDYDYYTWHILNAQECIFPYQPFPTVRKNRLFRS